MRKRIGTALAPLPLLLVILALIGCGGGGDGGQGGLNSFFRTATFTPAPASPFPQNGQVAKLVLASSTNDTVTFDVKGEGVFDLYNLSFDLLFDSRVLRFLPPAQLGTFFGNSSTATVVASENPAGDVVVGATRLKAAAPNGVTGSGTILSLTFAIQAKGTTALRFDPTRPLRGEDSAGVQTLDASNFFGGSLVIQ